MEATPDVYRADIAHTHAAIDQIDRELGAIASWIALFPTSRARFATAPRVIERQERRARLVRQLANLEHALARAERYWTRAEIQGAGTRLP